MYNNFTFYMPTKVLFGAGQLQNLHNEQMPGKKALIVTSNGQSTKSSAILPQLRRNSTLQALSTYSSTRFVLTQQSRTSWMALLRQRPKAATS